MIGEQLTAAKFDKSTLEAVGESLKQAHKWTEESVTNLYELETRIGEELSERLNEYDTVFEQVERSEWFAEVGIA